jgi:hypothetical protein
VRIPLARLGQSLDLVRLGYEQARAWLEGAPLPGELRARSGLRFAYRPPIPALDQSS